MLVVFLKAFLVSKMENLFSSTFHARILEISVKICNDSFKLLKFHRASSAKMKLLVLINML